MVTRDISKITGNTCTTKSIGGKGVVVHQNITNQSKDRVVETCGLGKRKKISSKFQREKSRTVNPGENTSESVILSSPMRLRSSTTRKPKKLPNRKTVLMQQYIVALLGVKTMNSLREFQCIVFKECQVSSTTMPM